AAAEEQVHRARVDDIVARFASGNPDGEIVHAVAIEIASGDAVAELLAGLGIPGDTDDILIPHLGAEVGDAADLGSAAGRAVRHHYRSGMLDRSVAGVDVLQRDADRDIVAAIGVEIAAGDGPAETIALLD